MKKAKRKIGSSSSQSVKMIGKRKNWNNDNVQKSGIPHKKDKKWKDGVAKKIDPTHKSAKILKPQGVKRKHEDLDDKGSNEQSQEFSENKQFKKRKLKHAKRGQNDSSEVVLKSGDSSHASLSVKSTGDKPGTAAVGVKNKFNVKPDKNWEALLKTLPKEAPKKAGPKKDPKRKTWRKPHPKQGKKHESKESNPKSSIDTGPKKIKRADIWFDDVDELLIEGLEAEEEDDIKAAAEPVNPLVKAHSFDGATKAVAMDCEMVGVGEDGVESVLARVSIVNRFGHVLLDKYVKPREKVTDFRTHVSGIRPSDLEDAEDFETVQREVHAVLKGRILVGHALHNDMQVLFLSHPRKLVRDTARYKPFRRLFNGRIPSLKNLSAKLLSVEVQSGEHSSVQDAQAAMRIYTMHRTEWEKSLKAKKPVSLKKKKSKTGTTQVQNSLNSDD